MPGPEEHRREDSANPFEHLGDKMPAARRQYPERQPEPYNQNDERKQRR